MYNQAFASPYEFSSLLPGLLQMQGSLLILLVFLGGAAFVFGGGAESAIARLVFKLATFGTVMMLSVYAVLSLHRTIGGDLTMTPARPGVFDWIVEHWMLVLGALVALAVGGSALYRFVTVRQQLHQVKLDVRALLGLIDLAEQVEADCKDAQVQGNHAAGDRDKVTTLLRQELVALLSQVHAGEVLQPGQRGRMEEIAHVLHQGVPKQESAAPVSAGESHQARAALICARPAGGSRASSSALSLEKAPAEGQAVAENCEAQESNGSNAGCSAE